MALVTVRLLQAVFLATVVICNAKTIFKDPRYQVTYEELPWQLTTEDTGSSDDNDKESSVLGYSILSSGDTSSSLNQTRTYVYDVSSLFQKVASLSPSEEPDYSIAPSGEPESSTSSFTTLEPFV